MEKHLDAKFRTALRVAHRLENGSRAAKCIYLFNSPLIYDLSRSNAFWPDRHCPVYLFRVREQIQVQRFVVRPLPMHVQTIKSFSGNHRASVFVNILTVRIPSNQVHLRAKEKILFFSIELSEV